MTVEDWLGEENQLGTDIWTKKYCNDGESFDEWIARISGGNEEIADYIRKKKFLFGGRILSNRGLDQQGRKVTYSNCYVIDPPEDNIESIRPEPAGGEDQQCGQGDERFGFLHGTVFSGDRADRTEREKRSAHDLHRLLSPGCRGVH